LRFVDANVTGKAFGGFNPTGGRAGVQAIGIVKRPIGLGITWPFKHFGRRGRHLNRIVSECADDQLRVIGCRQAVDALGPLHQAGQPTQQNDVLI